MTYDHWKSSETRDLDEDEWDEYEGEEECEHEWQYEILLDDGGVGDGGEGRCSCIYCGATPEKSN